MAQDVVINGTTYPAVESVALTDGNGNVTQFYPDAVRYVEQNLTEVQKAQARENIDALGADQLSSAVNEALEQAKTSGDFDGATGSRGFSALRITTAPSGYTTATGGFTPTYRVALSTVLSQSKSADVVVGDTIIYSYYTYPVGYVDSSYVYLGARVSIRGSTGAAGATPEKGTDYWTDADKTEIVNDVLAALPTWTGGSY